MIYLNEQEKQEEISVYKKAKYYIAKKNRQARLAIFCLKTDSVISLIFHGKPP